MGIRSSKIMKLNDLIFDLLIETKWQHRIWKIFCFKFEYKLFKINDHGKHTITWSEFDAIFFNSWTDEIREKDYKKYIFWHTMKRFFKFHNNEMRIYRIYMFYFPYVLHRGGAINFNFVDLIFEKTIYNLENEMHGGSELLDNDDLESSMNTVMSEESEKSSLESQAKERSEMFILDNKYLKGKSDKGRHNNMANNPLLNNDENAVPKTYYLIDNNLLSISDKYFTNYRKQKTTISKISLEIFREILFIYFNTNVIILLRSLKEMVKEFDDRKVENHFLISKINSFNHENIKVDKFTPANVYKYIDICLDRMLSFRTNLKSQDKKTIYLSLDEIYLFIKTNPLFLNSKKCYEEFENLI